MLDLPIFPVRQNDQISCLDLVPPERVSPQLRRALLDRGSCDIGHAHPRSLGPDEIRTLRAMVERIIPGAMELGIDLASRLDRMMAEQTGNGWRYEMLPSDPEAYIAGLRSLDEIAQQFYGRRFSSLSGEERDYILEQIERRIDIEFRSTDRLNAAQLALWFEEVRSDAVRHYVGHPAIMARIGYAGFANGGPSGSDFQGFSAVGIGEREDWEPSSASSSFSSELRS